MKEHECTIGMLYGYDSTYLATLEEVKKEIEDRKRLNSQFEILGLENHKRKEWSLKQYCDFRVHTNLLRFAYCPICGKKIDWKALRCAT